MHVYLIRHGVTEYNRLRKYQGSLEIPLSPEGREALQPAGFTPDQLWVSPRIRARQTAEILFPGVPFQVSEGLAEMNFGQFEGRSAQEMADDPDYVAWVAGGCVSAPPGGESRDAFSQRVCAALSAIVGEAVHEGITSLAVVAHSGTLMAAMERFGRPTRDYFEWRSQHGGGFEITVSEEEWFFDPVLHYMGEVQFGGVPL